MEWSELYKDLNKLKSDFDKSYKSLTQNRSIQQATINKHAEILVTRFNNARILMHEQRDRLDKNRWPEVSTFLTRLRSNLITIKERYNLNISIPTILNTPLKVETGDKLESSDPPEVDSVQAEESEFDSPEVEEKDLNNLTIPAVLFQSELSDQETIESDCEIEQHQIRTMTDETVAQRAYIKDIANAIPEFNGQKINLQRFITALKLVNLTKVTFEGIAVEVIKSKIVGSTLYKVQNESTINGIIKKLKDTIIGETTDVVKAKMAKTTQKGITAEKFTTEVDSLRKLLEAS